MRHAAVAAPVATTMPRALGAPAFSRRARAVAAVAHPGSRGGAVRPQASTKPASAPRTSREGRRRRFARSPAASSSDPGATTTSEKPPAPSDDDGPADAAADASCDDAVAAHEMALPPLLPSSRSDRYDLVVVGCGPAGLSAADRASSKGLRVALIDPDPLARWRNNYGVWVDEFEELGLEDCFNHVWPKARVVIDDETPEGIRLDRPYAQVDRIKLKDKLLRRCVDAGVVFGALAVDAVEHEDEGSVVFAKPTDDEERDASTERRSEIHASLVLDATGHVRKLVEFEREFTPGYQAAFGILCETVEPHGLPEDEMLFMDWRDAHLSPRYKRMNDDHPTFLYAMPFGPNKIFFEETSLVERPGLEFDDLKVKLQERLAHMGIEVASVEEEEYCLIPMGGVLPTLPQRVLGVGGTAGMVHPSTGFMVSKTLLSVRGLVDTMAEELTRAKEEGSSRGGKNDGETGGAMTTFDAAAASERVWRSVWPDDELRMRTFMCFGMETLMELDIKGTRQFFDTFFQMPQDIWGGFLSWRIRPLGLVKLGGVLFVKFSNYMRFNFVWSALPFMASFVKSFATADNEFQSDRWGGMELRRVPKSGGGDVSTETRSIPGQGPIPTPSRRSSSSSANPSNPCESPITSSPLDFSALIGGDMDTPRAASALRPDREWIEFQQRKVFEDQLPIADVLDPLPPNASVDVLVVGAGPAGLAVAAQCASRGVSVGLVAPDTPFVNNYGVWLDEFAELGLEHCLLHKYDDALVWFNDSDPAEGIGLGRGYGQVCRRRLREELLRRCKDAGVRYAPGLVESLTHADSGSDEPSVIRGTLKRGPPRVDDDDAEEGEEPKTPKNPSAADSSSSSEFEFRGRAVICSTGHNRDMLRYGEGPPPGWQTAYGIEVKMPGHPFAVNKAVFMDFRQSDPEVEAGSNGAFAAESGVWRVPSFLYVLPVDEDTVFVEETCLVARVQVPFDELKRRLYRRLSRMGLSVTLEDILEEEASWIPLGGTPPVAPQRTLAYGAAAGLVHPASGYSIVNSLRRAPGFAQAVVEGLKQREGGLGPEGGGPITNSNSGMGMIPASSALGWDVLWGDEPRRQVGFYQFGMELLMSLRIEQMRVFFRTFFGLPPRLSAGFLSNDLSSSELLLFALTVFVQGNWELRALLLTHLASAGAGVRLAEAYAYPLTRRLKERDEGGSFKGGLVASKDRSIERKKPPQEPNFTSFARDLFSAEAQGMMPGFQGKDWWAVGDGNQRAPSAAAAAAFDENTSKSKSSSKADPSKDSDDESDDDSDSDDSDDDNSSSITREAEAAASSVMGATPAESIRRPEPQSVSRASAPSPSPSPSLSSLGSDGSVRGGGEGSMAYWSNGSAAVLVTSAVRRTGLSVTDLYGEERKKFLPAALLRVAGGSDRIVPPYLTGEMPGDFGWDPLQMGAQRDIMKLRERELIHGRWAMLAAVGVLVPECTARLGVFGERGQHWWNTAVEWGDAAAPGGGAHVVPRLTYLGEVIPWTLAWLPVIHLPLFFIAELLRTGRYEIPAFEGLDRMYPGGRLFDPLEIGKGVSAEELGILKTIEITHCRLAMCAAFGFIVEAVVWGAGPLDVFP